MEVGAAALSGGIELPVYPRVHPGAEQRDKGSSREREAGPRSPPCPLLGDAASFPVPHPLEPVCPCSSIIQDLAWGRRLSPSSTPGRGGQCCLQRAGWTLRTHRGRLGLSCSGCSVPQFPPDTSASGKGREAPAAPGVPPGQLPRDPLHLGFPSLRGEFAEPLRHRQGPALRGRGAVVGGWSVPPRAGGPVSPSSGSRIWVSGGCLCPCFGVHCCLCLSMGWERCPPPPPRNPSHFNWDQYGCWSVAGTLVPAPCRDAVMAGALDAEKGGREGRRGRRRDRGMEGGGSRLPLRQEPAPAGQRC